MAFKSFKYKFYSKGYHSAAQKSATSFFDSSYQYLKSNQGLVTLDTAIPQQNSCNLRPHPVAGASVNYNNVKRALRKDSEMRVLELEVRQLHEREAELAAEAENGQNAGHDGPGALRQQRQRSNSFQLFAHEKSNIIDERMSHRYYSTTVQQGTPAPQSPADASKYSHTKAASVAGPATPESFIEHYKDTRLDESIPAWEEDCESCLNKETFLQVQTQQIAECMQTGNYNRVNALYQSLKRNDIVPSLATFEQVLESICRRDLDQNNIDNQMFELLNCYQDIIQNKLKPTKEIYSLVVGSLISGSIKGFDLHNANGLDFFKIAIDLFFASNLNHYRSFEQQFLDRLLLAINLYPGHVKYSYIKSFIDSSVNYDKNELYYITMLSYSKIMNEQDAVKDLYQDFRSNLKSNIKLVEHQYEVYSVILSAFVETGSLGMATKLLDKLAFDRSSKQKRPQRQRQSDTIELLNIRGQVEPGEGL